MSYRNDPYDPKQAALLAPEALDAAVDEARKAFDAAADLDALGALKPAHLGDRSPVSLARREIGSLPPAAKSDAGKRVNLARQSIQGAFDARLAELEIERAARVLVEERVDVTLPWDRRPRGARHPLTTLMEHMADLFVGMGYEIVDGPRAGARVGELRRAQHRPGQRRCAASMDSFYVDLPGLVMRTHTSPGQVRTHADPAAADLRGEPGAGVPHRTSWTPRTARCSTRSRVWSWTRASPWPTCAAPSTTSPGRCSGRTRRTRWRPHYFPFTEPSGRVRRVVRAAPRRPALGRVGWLRHGQPAGADRLRHRPGAVLRLRVRHGRGAHADVPQRGLRTCATWSRATPGSPVPSEWRSDADEDVTVVAA